MEVNGEKKNLEPDKLGKIKQDIDFIYIPANRSSRDIEWDEHTVFSRLVMHYLDDYTRNSDRLSRR